MRLPIAIYVIFLCAWAHVYTMWSPYAQKFYNYTQETKESTWAKKAQEYLRAAQQIPFIQKLKSFATQAYANVPSFEDVKRQLPPLPTKEFLETTLKKNAQLLADTLLGAATLGGREIIKTELQRRAAFTYKFYITLKNTTERIEQIIGSNKDVIEENKKISQKLSDFRNTLRQRAEKGLLDYLITFELIYVIDEIIDDSNDALSTRKSPEDRRSLLTKAKKKANCALTLLLSLQLDALYQINLLESIQLKPLTKT